MGNKIRITTSELSAQAERLRSAAQKAEEIKEKSYQALALVGEAFPLVRKQDYLVISRIKKLISNLEIGAQVAANSAETYNNMDQELRKLMGDSLPDSIVNEPISGQSVITYDQQQAEIMRQIIASGGRIDTSGYPGIVGFYLSDGRWRELKKGYGCTWYAYSRYKEMNPGAELIFADHPGDAKNWIQSIDHSKFEVIPTTYTSEIKSNSLAVSSTGEYGHVVYIEAVTDDGRVIFSESNYSSSNDPGKVVEMSIEEFQQKFQHIITAKTPPKAIG